jgi:hypothetical protein
VEETDGQPGLAAELDGDEEAVKMRYAFSALYSTGVMMPMGFEFGFRRPMDVVKTTPEDWEKPAFDLPGFITRINEIKRTRRAFNEQGPIERLDLRNGQVVALLKRSLDGREKGLIPAKPRAPPPRDLRPGAVPDIQQRRNENRRPLPRRPIAAQRGFQNRHA